MRTLLFDTIDRFLISEMHKWGIPTLRIALGVVFLWFGALKLFGVTPVTQLVSLTYYFLPIQGFLIFLGVWEVAIGIGLIFKIALRATLALLWLQMAGTLFSAVLNPLMFFQSGNPFLLTIEGEFIIKNFVLIAAALVIGGYEVLPRHTNEKSLEG